MQAKFRHGNPLMVDFTPSGSPVSSVSAGDVVVIGDVPMVAHSDIAEDAVGALAAFGGVYEMDSEDTDLTQGESVYWDASNEVVSDNETGSGYTLPHFGFVAPNHWGPGSGSGKVNVIHLPNGTATT